MPEDEVTRSEIESLKASTESTRENLANLAHIVEEQGKNFYEEMKSQEAVRRQTHKELQDSITKLAEGVYERINRVDGKRQQDSQERSKLPTAVLSLVLSVIFAVGGVLGWNMMRIENDSKEGDKAAERYSKERHISQDATHSKQLELMLEAFSKQAGREHEQLMALAKEVQELRSTATAHAIEDAARNARTDERSTILYHLYTSGLIKQGPPPPRHHNPQQ